MVPTAAIFRTSVSSVLFKRRFWDITRGTPMDFLYTPGGLIRDLVLRGGSGLQMPLRTNWRSSVRL